MPYRRAPLAGTPVRAERFRAALQPRVLGRAGLGEQDNLRALHVERGNATLRTADAAPVVLTGPAVGWFPWRGNKRLHLGAGAQGRKAPIFCWASAHWGACCNGDRRKPNCAFRRGAVWFFGWRATLRLAISGR